MNTYGHYQNAYKRAAVNTMDQTKLIIMLYDGAIKYVGMGIESLKRKEIEKAHNSLVKTKAIVSELMASLNMEKGGEIAKNLQSLYAYMFDQLIEANVTKNPMPAQTVLGLLKELREAWLFISKQGKQQPEANANRQRLGGQSEVKRINLKS